MWKLGINDTSKHEDKKYYWNLVNFKTGESLCWQENKRNDRFNQNLRVFMTIKQTIVLELI